LHGGRRRRKNPPFAPDASADMPMEIQLQHNAHVKLGRPDQVQLKVKMCATTAQSASESLINARNNAT
jgi:hypothetical protein